MADRKQQVQQQPQQYDVSKIDALYSWLSYDIQKMKSEIMGELKYSSIQVTSLCQEMKSDKDNSTKAIAQEIRYSYKQNQTIYDGLSEMLSKEVGEGLTDINAKIAEIEEKTAVLETIEKALEELKASHISEQTRQILDAVAALPVPEGVDYARIADEVGEKMTQVISEVKNSQAATLETLVDYNKIINGTAEKVVESLPYPEKIDYRRISDIAESAVANAMAKAFSAIEIDYERLADMVAAKLANAEKSYDVVLDDAGIEKIAEKVSARLNVAEAIDYDKVCQAAAAAQVAAEPIDYDRIAEIVEDKMACDSEEPSYDLVIDGEGIEAIANGVAEKLCGVCNASSELGATEAVEETVEEIVAEEPAVEEAPVEEEPAVEEIAEEPVVEEVASAADEAVEEPVEEIAAETVVEEYDAEAEATAREEIAASVVASYKEVDNQLVDAETGLVIRLKKSFTAKMRQSEEKIKGYYSDIKNELTSYKKINSNVSWHGDRFNYGRDTIAKINICGKTLCFYVALDPNDPELKTTLYHQKDVGNQKAYESTPFMVKIKSDAAAKKALRLVGFLAEKVGAEKDEKFEAVDYVEQFGYQSTKTLFEDGFIKATKEKKVDLDF